MSERDAYSSLYALVGEVPDPRQPRGTRHPIADVLFILLVAVLAGAEDAQAVEDFGVHHQDWFRERCGLPHGIPSQDTYLRVLATMAPRAFGEAFERWVAEVWGVPEQRHVAIDGKALRRSFDRAAGLTAVHSVAAFASERGVVLGQVTVNDKENEIVAIPRLLRLIDLRGATVTIDAMGCQTAIAHAIVEEGGDYILQVKGNHPTLRSQLVGFFADASREQRPIDDPAPAMQEAVETDSGHGRIEERRCQLVRDLSWIDRAADWRGLSAIAKLERRRENKATGETSNETAYYLVSNPDATAAQVNALIRSHWAIENSLHWTLDVTFDEDRCRVRKGNAAENFGLIRRAAVNLLRSAPNPGRKRAKVSIARRRRHCMMSTAYREAVLRLEPVAPA
jgi:predicted transposase YbfD/YdcC